jgi:hypothetical protein
MDVLSASLRAVTGTAAVSCTKGDRRELEAAVLKYGAVVI